MSRLFRHWKSIALLYIVQLFSHTTCAINIQLIAPRYIHYHSTATLYCNHSVPENDLHKIEFKKDDESILQYIKGRKPPFVDPGIDNTIMEYSKDGKTITLRNVSFEASGSYACAVSTTSPIYTKVSDPVQMKVIVPQTKNPKITFEKSVYVIGENLEANCSSGAARPVPHLTWFINGKEVDVTLVNHYPHTRHKDHLMSATAKLMVEVSELHAGENGYLEISCHSTIPDYPMHHEQYADIKKKTVSVQIIPAPIPTSSAVKISHKLILIMVTGVIYVARPLIS